MFLLLNLKNVLFAKPLTAACDYLTEIQREWFTVFVVAFLIKKPLAGRPQNNISLTIKSGMRPHAEERFVNDSE